jgi:hypothetical protein
MPESVTSSQSTTTEATPSPEVVTFLVLGCPRCGTTWIDRALREHPEVYLPAQKQSYFFDQNFDKGLDWYLANFRDIPEGKQAVGEVATSYTLPHAFPMVADHFGHAKMVVTIRNPIDRAYSYYLSRKEANGWKSFEEGIEAEPDIVKRGEYIDQIEMILERVPRERLLVLFFDDLESDDRAFLRRLLTFIDADPAVEVSALGQQVNAVMYPRLRRLFHRLGLKPILTAVSRSRLGDAIRRRRRKAGGPAYEPMREETRARLAAHYKPFNDRLAAFAGRDLSHWK